MDKSADAFRTISEVALELDIPQHVLRFWETRFPQLRPLKRGGGRRYYRPLDVDLLRSIRRLLYADGYTIRGVQKILKARGIRAVATMSPDDAEAAARIDADLRSNAGEAEEAGASLPDFGLDRSGLAALLEELRLCARILDDARGSTPGEPVRDPAGLHSVDAP